jgi:hypothetical protein
MSQHNNITNNNTVLLTANGILTNGSSCMSEDNNKSGYCIPIKPDGTVTASVVAPTCSKRGCRNTGNDIPVKCANPECGRYIHQECFDDTTRAKYPRLLENELICTQKCYAKAVAVGRTKKSNWATDGAGGPDDPNSSERILLDWLLVPGNYHLKWRGKENGGLSKAKVAANLADMMNEKKVTIF